MFRNFFQARRADYLREIRHLTIEVMNHDIPISSACDECANIAKRYKKFQTTVLRDLRDSVSNYEHPTC